MAAHSLLIDPATDDLLPINFNLAHRIGGPGYPYIFDIFEVDIALVMLTVHSILTGEKSFQNTPSNERVSNAAIVEELEEDGTWWLQIRHYTPHRIRPSYPHYPVSNQWVLVLLLWRGA